MGFVDFTKLLFAFVLTFAAIQSIEKYSRTLLRNTKLAQSLRRTFSRRNSRKKSRSDYKMAASEVSVHPLEIVFVTISSFTKRTKAVPKVFQVGECCLEG